MRIGILFNDFEKSSLFINLGIYLQKLGHEVVILNPQRHIESLVSKHGLEKLKYSRNVKESIRSASLDIVLIWNGERNNQEVRHCRELKIGTWFFENGYWQGETIQVNRSGVNAKAEFSNLDPLDLLRFSFHKKNIDKKIYSPVGLKKPYFKYLIYKFHQLFQSPGSVLKSINKITQKKAASFKYKFFSKKIHTPPASSFAFFPLQVTTDTQVLKNSPYESTAHVIRLFIKKYSDSLNILFKYHPKETSLVRYENLITKKHQIVGEAPLNALIEKCEFLINVNSSVGFQALEKGKKILHLGDSFYQEFHGVIKCNLLIDNLTEKIQELRRLSYDPKANEVLFQHFKEKIFISGDWKNPSTKTLHDICERIL